METGCEKMSRANRRWRVRHTHRDMGHWRMGNGQRGGYEPVGSGSDEEKQI